MTKEIDEEYVLYIVMRNDLDSLCAGKGMAQAAHAQAVFEDEVGDKDREIYHKWRKEGGSFGTTIILASDLSKNFDDESSEVIGEALKENYVAGVVHDPTYPIRDGLTTHLIPLDTCFFVFAPMDNDLLYDYKLLKSRDVSLKDKVCFNEIYGAL